MRRRRADGAGPPLDPARLPPGASPGGRSELADLVARLFGLGFDECIAVSWMDWVDGGFDRSVDDLASFVGEDLPALTGR